MNSFNLQPFLDELLLGSMYGVFIDDSASPGWQPTSTDASNPYPIGDSWVAVILPPSHMTSVYRTLRSVLKVLKKYYKAREFHCSEIYSGRGVFKHIDLEERFLLLTVLAEIIRDHKLPIVVRTLDPSSKLLEIGHSRSARLGGIWDLRKPKDMGFIALLRQVEEYLRAESAKNSLDTVLARVFIDEGYLKSGFAMAGFPAFAEESIYFADSTLAEPLQLADFAAFTINRHQLLMTKDVLSPTDVLFLRISSMIVPFLRNVELKPVRMGAQGGPNPVRSSNYLVSIWESLSSNEQAAIRYLLGIGEVRPDDRIFIQLTKRGLLTVDRTRRYGYALFSQGFERVVLDAPRKQPVFDFLKRLLRLSRREVSVEAQAGLIDFFEHRLLEQRKSRSKS